MKKRIISVILAITFVIAAVPQSLAAGFVKVNTYENGKFSDVATKDWFETSVASA